MQSNAFLCPAIIPAIHHELISPFETLALRNVLRSG